jgi:hypothetical protein
VQGIRSQGVLVSGKEENLPPDCEIFFPACGDTGFGRGRRHPGKVKANFSPAAAESLLLARVVAHRWVTVFRADLAGKEDYLLGAAALGVDIDQDGKAYPVEYSQAEISHLEGLTLAGSDHYTRSSKIFLSLVAGLPFLFLIH